MKKILVNQFVGFELMDQGFYTNGTSLIQSMVRKYVAEFIKYQYKRIKKVAAMCSIKKRVSFRVTLESLALIEIIQIQSRLFFADDNFILSK